MKGKGEILSEIFLSAFLENYISVFIAKRTMLMNYLWIAVLTRRDKNRIIYT